MRRKRKSYRNKDARFFEKWDLFKKKLRYLTICDNKRRYGKNLKNHREFDRI